MIKTTYLSYRPIVRYIPTPLYALTKHVCFEKFIAENRKCVCVVDGEIVSPDEGNKIFRELKAKNPGCKIEKEFNNFNDKEIIKYIDSKIDKYAHYIDSHRQRDEAEDRNYKIRKVRAEFIRISEEK